MKSESTIDPREFVAAVQPLLERQDAGALRELLCKHWTREQILALLSSPDCDARKVAALALSLMGGTCCIERLADQLKDPDPCVNQMAEHALWAIWLRGSKSHDANCDLACGVRALNERNIDKAVECFDRAIAADPQFAEAYNQRAIAAYLREDYAASIIDCRRTVKRMPCHFGAWAGLGHCLACLDRLPEAVDAYEHALEVNPHLISIRQTVDELKRKIENPGGI